MSYLLSTTLTFFYTIDIPTHLVEAVKTGFPPSVLAFLLQQHLAARVIQGQGVTSEIMCTVKGIVARCRSSVALTRSYLKRSIRDIDRKYPEANTNIYVDDSCMQAVVGDDFDGALESVVVAVTRVGDKVKSLFLSLSDKAAAFASSKSLASASS